MDRKNDFFSMMMIKTHRKNELISIFSIIAIIAILSGYYFILYERAENKINQIKENKYSIIVYSGERELGIWYAFNYHYHSNNRIISLMDKDGIKTEISGGTIIIQEIK